MARLDLDIKGQLREIFAPLSASVTLLVKGDSSDPAFKDMEEFARDFASASERLDVRVEDAPTESGAPVLSLLRDGAPLGVKFVGVPGGHEFSTLIMAVMNASGLGRNLPDGAMRDRIAAINGPLEIFTFVSLTCAICPDVAQALNIIVLLNPAISNSVIDGGAAPDLVKQFNINGVPTVYADGELLSVGQATVGELVTKLEKRFGTNAVVGDTDLTPMGFDALIAGGGPAGAASAIYLARKGMKVAVVAGRIGGQVKDTGEIENLISVPSTTGSALASDIRRHLDAYGISVFDNRTVIEAEVAGDVKRLKADSGEVFEAPAIVIATGAAWRRLGVPGEEDYLGKGVAFCTHCDGPFYAGKRVAVAGGGNSGVEAAIDLAGICTHVDLFEFLDALKADEVLQKKLASLNNVEVHLSTALTEVKGDGRSVTSVVAKGRVSGEEKEYPVSGLFVQIGLVPNSAPFAAQVGVNSRGEIKVDANCRTDLRNVYAAGDVTDVPYKQIVIAMGEGAKAALSLFDDRMRASDG